MMRRATLGLGVLALSILFVSGCGPTPVKVTGKVVNKGQPYTLSDKGMFIISFFDEKDETFAKPFAVDSKLDGTFTVVGVGRKGIPPGKYKVAVQAMDPYQKQEDKLKGKFAPRATKLTADVAAGKEVVLDVGQ